MNNPETFAIQLLDINRHEDFYHLVTTNRDRLEDFFAGTVARMQTLEAAKAYCTRIAELIQEKKYFPFMICDRESGKYIGLVDIKTIEWSVPKAELGYFVDHAHEGRGIATKAFAKVVDLAARDHGFRKLLCRINGKNLASVRVAVKSGFQLEGTIRCDYVTTSGDIVDLDYYGRVFGG